MMNLPSADDTPTARTSKPAKTPKRKAGRRRNGEGTIRHRADGRWEVRVSLADGGQKSYYAKTRDAAYKRLVEAQHSVQSGLPIGQDERVTVGQWLTQWLAQRRPDLKASSANRYELTIRKQITPHLGKVRLARLSPAQLQSFYATLRTQEGLSPTTVRMTHALLHEALENALRLGMVARNVADLVTPPRRAAYEATVLTEEQARTFQRAVAGHRYEAFFLLAIHTGMRRGELLGLRWRDVDLDGGRVAVRHSLTWRRSSEWTLDTPKTAGSVRDVDLAAPYIEALRRHRARQNAERLAAGALWEDHDLVFASPSGRPLRGDHIRERDFHTLLKDAGLPQLRLHDLRHTSATLVQAAGASVKETMARLGHTTMAMTVTRYTHTLPGQQRAAADRFADRLADDDQTQQSQVSGQ